MNHKILPVFAFVFFFFTVYASASTQLVNVSAVNASGTTFNVNAGQTFDVSFQVFNNHALYNLNNTMLFVYAPSQFEITQVRLNNQAISAFSSAITPPASSSEVQVTRVLLSGNVILPNQTSNVLTATIKAVSGLSPGTRPMNISLSTNYNASLENNIDMDFLPLTVNVQQAAVSSNVVAIKTQEITLSQNGAINISNNDPVNYATFTLSVSGGLPVDLSDYSVTLAPKTSYTVQVIRRESTVYSKFAGDSATVRVTGPSSFTSDIGFSFVRSFCSKGDIGENLTIEEIALSVRGDGTEDSWKVGDEVRVRVKVRNQGVDKSISNVKAQLGVFTDKGTDVTDLVTFTNSGESKISIGRIATDSDKRVDFVFIVTPELLSEAQSFKLAVKAYSDDLGESRMCADKSDSSGDLNNVYYQQVSLDQESDVTKSLTFSKVSVSPTELFCGDNVIVDATVTNIGSDSWDKTRYTLSNTELGISTSYTLTRTIGTGDSEPISFSFAVPTSARNKSYDFGLSYELDESGGVYQERSDSPYILPLNITGCAQNIVKTTDIRASLDSASVAGSEIRVKAVITNTGSSSASYLVSANNYESWGEILSISERAFTLNPLESKEITLTFKANSDAVGEKTFTLEAIANGKSETRDVVLNIDKAAAKGFSFDFGGNAVLWIIGAVNVLLIILIIVVAVRVSRK